MLLALIGFQVARATTAHGAAAWLSARWPGHTRRAGWAVRGCL